MSSNPANPGGATPMYESFPNAQNITKSDSTVYNPPLRQIYVAGAGDVVLRKAVDGTLVTLTVDAKTWIKLWSDKVMSTGTTATGLVGYW